MYLPNDQSKLFCLECVAEVDDNRESSIFPFLEQLVRQHGVVNVYKACDSIESFEESLNILLYEDRSFQDYDLLYFICQGNGEDIMIDGYIYSLGEIAELFEGKLKGKILHFSNSKDLNLDSETAQYFLDVTGAKAVSGYMETNSFSSAALDMQYFGLYQDLPDVRDLVETLFEKHYALCTRLGFHLYY